MSPSPDTSTATGAGEPETAISARSLRRSFKGGIEAVRDIDLTIAPGEVFGFLGPNGAGTTVFLTTQYMDEADQLCERVAIIDAGRIVAEGTPRQLKAGLGHDVVSLSLDGAQAEAAESALVGLPGLERVLVVEPGAVALYVEDGAGSVAEIVRRLDRHGIATAGIAVARPSLDDVFLQATGRRLEGQDQATEPQETP